MFVKSIFTSKNESPTPKPPHGNLTNMGFTEPEGEEIDLRNETWGKRSAGERKNFGAAKAQMST